MKNLKLITIKRSFLITVILVLTSVSGFSQIQLEKTTINGENWFRGNEATMDSIYVTYNKFKLSLSKVAQFKLQLKLLQAKFDRSKIQVNFLTVDAERLELEKTELKLQLDTKDEIHAIDLLYYKEKAKGKFKAFLFGTATGAVIVAILMTVLQK